MARSSQGSLFRTPSAATIAANHLWSILYGNAPPGPSALSSGLRRFGARRAADIAESPLLQLLLGAAPGAGGEAKMVFHGTPHIFEPVPGNPLGRFELSKIGTGEGAQAYGHGIYLAEHPEVAKSYTSHGPPGVPTEVNYQGKSYQPGTDKAYILEQVAKRGRLDVINQLRKDAQFYRGPGLSPTRAQSLIDLVAFAKTVRPDEVKMRFGGNLLRVHIPDEQISRMLDWDARFGEHPRAVRDVLSGMGRPGGSLYNDPMLSSRSALWNDALQPFEQNSTTGRALYGILSGNENQPAASALLARSGIPGMQYFDQGSRTGGTGTRNYVIYDPSILRIMGVEGP